MGMTKFLLAVAKFLMVRAVEVGVVIVLFVFMPSIPPNSNFSQYKVAPVLPLEGKLSLNERLNGVQHIYENELRGPESFAEYNGELYTSIHGGDVVKLVGEHIVPVVKFGKPCKGYHEESICGRPLGMNFDKDGMLYVADGYMGIWKVDIKTGKKVQLVSMDIKIEGRKPLLPNGIVISSTGDVYWTDSTTEFTLQDGVYAMLTDATGRLIHYNPITRQNKVLLDNIHFSNGLAFTENEEAILISESARSRILRYYLKGTKKGTHDIFIDGLPGIPDNIKPDGKNGFLVPMILARDELHPVAFQIFGQFPLVRKLFARVLGVADASFKTIEKIYPNFYSQRAIHWVGHFDSIYILAPRRVTMLHISKDGEIIDSVHSNDKSFYGLSEVHVFNDHLYMGSPFNNYVGRIPLSKAGLEQLGRYKREATIAKPVETPKSTAAPVKQTPPPTKAPVKQTPPPTQPPVKQTPRPTQAPVKETPPPTQAPVKQTQPPTQAPVKQTPPPTQAPVKQTPPATQAPVKQTPPPTQAPVKQTPPPTQAPTKQTAPPLKEIPKQTPPAAAVPTKQAPPPAATPEKQIPPPVTAPVKQAPPSSAAPVKQAPPPSAAPVKQAPPPSAAPVKQAPPPSAAPVKQAPPPSAAPVKQASAPTVAPVKQAPPPPTAAPVQQTPPPAPAPVKQAPTQQTPPPAAGKPAPAKQEPPVIPVKDKVNPKSESIPPRN